MLELVNITDEAMRNYHFLWYSYISRKNFTLFCRRENNCNEEPLKFLFAEEDWHSKVVEEIRNFPEMGKLIETESNSPPCTNLENVQKMKIVSICRFLQNISSSNNVKALLKLMKYTKQSPVFLEDFNDFENMGSISAKYGYTLKKNSAVSIISNHNLLVSSLDYYLKGY